MFQTLSDALSERGYDTLTAVQEAVTDPGLNDADLLVSAQTGSGKTVAFGLAIAPTLLAEDGSLGPAGAPLALIIAPTRELALQVMRELSWLYGKAGARVTTCIGGMDARDERRALERGAHIVVGTPGRLRDHIQRGSLDMDSLRAIVLDEADEMLDLGFREDLEFMLGEAPDERRTLLFSATVPPLIAKLAEQFQRDAVRVNTVSGTSQHADISYQAVRVAQHDAENAIINLLRFHDAENAIVFANTRAMVNRLTARLTNRGFSVVALSGELSQQERTHALQAMRDGRARVCVATDVAARGIDLPKLELVIHAELPSNAEGLLHRSGRTGRAGRKGISALIVPPKITKKAERLLRFAKITAEWTTAPSADDVLRRDEERLLSDPVWSEEATPEQQAFAEKLLALHGPEKIAAAYLALHRSRVSAPEDLSDPDTRPERRERKPFGPSAWVALSVGRDDRAEPRWLLPLLLRAGDLDKDAIGAIRIQQKESYIEVAEPALPGLMSALASDGELERGVKVRKLDGAPDMAPPPRKTGPKKPHRGSGDAPRPKSRAEKAPDRMAEAISDGAVKPFRKPGQDKPAKPAKADSPAGKPKPAKSPAKPKDAAAPKAKPAYKDSAPKGKWADKPGPDKGKPAGKPHASEGKPSGKPKGKPSAATGKPAPARGKAADTSKRFTPPGAKPGKPARPGKPKPGGKLRKGGDGPPRRR